MNRILFSSLFSLLLLCGCTSDIRPGECFSPPVADTVCERDFSDVQNNVKSNSLRGDFAVAEGGFFQPGPRMMAYTSGFTITVKDDKKAMDELKTLAEKLGGYLVARKETAMNLKVPAVKADEFLKGSAKSGEISKFRVDARDLTDTIVDLEMRLDNLRKFRIRLTELLGKAQKVDEMLKIERELNRVTTEIERIDAQLQNNKKQVKFVTFDIIVIEESEYLPAGTPEAVRRFNFLQNFAQSLSGKEEKALFGLTLPSFMVTAAEENGTKGVFTAITDDNSIFRSWENEIPEKSELSFWQNLCCKALETYESFGKIKVAKVKFNGRDAVKITAERTADSGAEKYFAVISVKRGWNDSLQVVEFFGPAAAFDKYEKAVSEAVLK